MTKSAVFFAVFVAAIGGAQASDPWADAVVAHSAGLTGSGLYNDPAAVLGAPTTQFYEAFEDEYFFVSVVTPPLNRASPDGPKVITTIPASEYVIVAFDEPVEDDPRNPYGLDLLIFGNAFFIASVPVTPESDMAEVFLPTGVAIDEPVIVAVSSTGIGTPQTHPAAWYVYADGPWADSWYPTQAYAWDAASGAWGDPLDFTLPVNPALASADFIGRSVAEVSALYGGSGGGSGFDLAESGFSSIRYVYLSSAFAGEPGEIDALADVFALLGDADRDGAVTLADYAALQRCFAGGDVEATGTCRFADWDGDGDLDLADYASFAAFLTGPASK
jgi:hypothetical protein